MFRAAILTQVAALAEMVRDRLLKLQRPAARQVDYNSRFVAMRFAACEAERYLRVSEGSPMRLALPYLGIGFCVLLTGWLSLTLIY